MQGKYKASLIAVSSLNCAKSTQCSRRSKCTSLNASNTRSPEAMIVSMPLLRLAEAVNLEKLQLKSVSLRRNQSCCSDVLGPNVNPIRAHYYLQIRFVHIETKKVLSMTVHRFRDQDHVKLNAWNHPERPCDVAVHEYQIPDRLEVVGHVFENPNPLMGVGVVNILKAVGKTPYSSLQNCYRFAFYAFNALCNDIHIRAHEHYNGNLTGWQWLRFRFLTDGSAIHLKW